jgi:hypothetical protein
MISTAKKLAILTLALLAFYRSPAAAEIKNEDCAASIKSFAKKLPNRAYALTADGSGCGVAWGFDRAEQAVSVALRECRRNPKGGTCKLMKTDGPANQPNSPSCVRDFRKWRSYEGYKAFALSGNGTGCGWAWGERTMAAAESQALRSCEKDADGCHIIKKAGR